MWEAHQQQQQQQQHTGSIYCNNTHSTLVCTWIPDTAHPRLSRSQSTHPKVHHHGGGGTGADRRADVRLGAEHWNQSGQRDESRRNRESYWSLFPRRRKPSHSTVQWGLTSGLSPFSSSASTSSSLVRYFLNSPLFSSSHGRSVGVRKQTG